MERRALHGLPEGWPDIRRAPPVVAESEANTGNFGSVRHLEFAVPEWTSRQFITEIR